MGVWNESSVESSITNYKIKLITSPTCHCRKLMDVIQYQFVLHPVSVAHPVVWNRVANRMPCCSIHLLLYVRCIVKWGASLYLLTSKSHLIQFLLLPFVVGKVIQLLSSSYSSSVSAVHSILISSSSPFQQRWEVRWTTSIAHMKWVLFKSILSALPWLFYYNHRLHRTTSSTTTRAVPPILHCYYIVYIVYIHNTCQLCMQFGFVIMTNPGNEDTIKMVAAIVSARKMVVKKKQLQIEFVSFCSCSKLKLGLPAFDTH